MKQLIIWGVAFCGLIGCEETEVIIEEVPEYQGKFAVYEGCSNGDCDYSIVKTSSLSVDKQDYGTYVNVVSGDNMVFNFQFDYHDEEQIADDELTEIIYFEVNPAPTGTSSFKLTAEQANAYFGAICFCGGGPFLKVTQGSVSGVQVSDSIWDVDVDLIVGGEHYPERVIQYSARYVVK